MRIKHSGYSLLEILIAMALSAIVITTAVQSIGSIYFSQKKIRVTQSFATETQFLMERIVQLVRTNTIDYDRYFIEVGPSIVSCASFDENQSSTGNSETNNPANRLILGYETVFYWDTNNDGTLNRNLGGNNLGGNVDSCTEAWTEDQLTMYLINSSRTLRVAVRKTLTPDPADDDFAKIEIEQQLGADTDNDGNADIWNAVGQWDAGNTVCKIDDGGGNLYKILGDETSRDLCMHAHEWTVVSPGNIEIENLSFAPAPNRDPFLGFAVDATQMHPHVVITMETTLRDPSDFGMEDDEVPNIALQTAASSRVFGNIRK